MIRFPDRLAAGHQLAAALREFAGRNDALVLALPRGGVPVGFALAQDLRLPLDIFMVRKLGVPGHEELAMGAVASGGMRVLNEEVIRELAIAPEQIEAAAAREQAEIARRELALRNRPPEQPITSTADVSGRHKPTFDLSGVATVIIVDDGLATGSTMRAAVKALQLVSRSPAHRLTRSLDVEIVVAVPVGAASTSEALRREADRVLCLQTPPDFLAVGQYYQDFTQTTDDEVRDYLRRAHTIS